MNFDLEREIWGRVFKTVLKVAPRECSLMLTEPMFNFKTIQAATEQIVFEEFGFQSFYAAPAPVFSMKRGASLFPNAIAYQAGAGVVGCRI